MTSPWPAAILLTLPLLLCGCPATTETNTRNERWYATMVEPMHSDPERALIFYDRIIKLKGAELTHELDQARQVFDKSESELNRVELSMILSLPGTGFRDEHAAINLLQPFLRDKNLEESSLRPLALLLTAQFAELRRLDQALQQQSSKAKEEQRRAEALQQKLEALLEIEMKMIEREQTIPTKKK